MSQKPTQLSLDVFLRKQSTFDNFIAEANPAQVAKQQLLNLVNGKVQDSALLWGSKGCGLTHMLQATCHAAAEQGLAVQYLPLAECMNFSATDVLGDLSQLDILCLDDLESCSGKADWEVALFNLFNELKESKRVLIAAMHVSPTELSLGESAIQLPDLRSRLLSSATFQVPELTDDGKVLALKKRAESVAMDLPDEVAKFLFSRVSRDSEALFQLLNRLEEASLSQQRKLTIPFVKQELELS